MVKQIKTVSYVELDADGNIMSESTTPPEKDVVTAKGQRGFKSADGKGMDEIKAMVEEEGWDILKHKKVAGKFVFIDPDMNAFITRHIGRIGLLYDQIKKKGVAEYVASSNPEVSTRQDLLDEKVIKISRAKLKEMTKEKDEKVEALNQRRTDLAVKIMSLSLKRGSSEHISLREQLHEVVDELKEMGAYETGSMSAVSHESLVQASIRGKALKKERKAKKEAKKRGSTFI